MMADFDIDKLVISLPWVAKKKFKKIMTTIDKLAISLPWVAIKKFKKTMTTIEDVLLDAEDRQTNSEALGIWLKKLEEVLLDASDMLDQFERDVRHRSQDSAGRKLRCFFSSSNPLVFRFSIGHKIKKMGERIDEITAEGYKVNQTMHGSMETYSLDVPVSVIRERVLEMVAKIHKLYLYVTFSLVPAWEVTDLDEDLYVLACIFVVCVDPFFLYIPFLSHTKMCLGMNKTLWKVAVALRTYYDVGFAIVLKAFYDVSFAVALKTCHDVGFAESITRDPTKTLNLCVGCFAFAPIPQVLFSEKLILKTLRGYTFWNFSLFCQYGTRLVLIFRSCEQLKTRISVAVLGLFNPVVYLFLYLIAGQVIGAFWYYLSIKRQVSCWNHVCKIDTGCVPSIFRCDGTTTLTLNSTLVNEFCPINPPNAAVFDYGIYLDALQSHIAEDKGLLKKFLRSFFWGLRNLSSFASNLQTSADVGETLFAIAISVVALILLIYIIGNIQRYAELASARSERIVDMMKLIKPKIKILVKSHNLKEFTEMWIVQQIQSALENNSDSFNFESFPNNPLHPDDTMTESLLQDLHFLETSILNPKKHIQGKAKKWLSDNNIPPYRNNILFYLTCGLKDDEDVNLRSVLSVLPDESKWRTMKDLCFDTLKKVPRLRNIDEEWFKNMSSKLKPVVYPKESYIFREGEPLDFLIFITSGVAWSYTTSTNASSNSLEKGDFFGEQLLQWKLDKRRELELDRIPLSCIPFSTANVKSHTQVEALVLMTEDLALCSDFPIDSSRSADLAIERVDRSSRTEEGGSGKGKLKRLLTHLQIEGTVAFVSTFSFNHVLVMFFVEK